MVRIEATGFAEPSRGGPDDIGHGSGFIVDPSGIIVTNSHVVTGAESVTVWIGSELTKQTADVVGVSECSDLAVIRIKGREDLPYLDWYEGAIEAGLKIHAAGYPVGGAKPKVTRGSLSGALGATDEARLSVDDTIELNANIPAGSAGGPVVSNDGTVVAVTYPSDDPAKLPFAISRDQVRPILQILQAGGDVSSVGINGYAQKSDLAGIWVVAVKPGSPAAKAGILPGDVVTDLAGKSMAANGTMAEYCEVLGGYEEGDPLSFTVFREASRATLDGELNGNPVKPEFAFAFAVDVGRATPGPPQPWTSRSTGARGTLSVDAPPTWKKLDHAWKFGDTWVGPGLLIAPNVEMFIEGYEKPGALVTASATLGLTTKLEDVLNADVSGLLEDDCKPDDRATFTRGGYTGIYDLWKACKGEKSEFLTIAAAKADGSVIYIQFQAAEPADLVVLDRMLVTLKFTPDGS